MKPGTKLGLKWLAAIALAAVAIYVFLPQIAMALGAGVSLAAYIFTIIVVPIFFLALGRFVYSLWLKPYFRAWHINRIRNARQLQDVIDRSRSGE